MKNKKLNLIAVLLILFLTQACQPTSNNNRGKVKIKPQCTYQFTLDSTDIIWSGYKFNDRAAVKGVFDSISVLGSKISDNPTGCLDGVEFSILTSSINSNDKGRDAKLSGIYFDALKTPIIKGSIDSVNHSNNQAKLTLSMNNISITKDIRLDISNNKIELKTNLNIEDWNGASAVEALNKACEEKHTGNDKESVLWPDVDVLVRTRLIKVCK
jgi:polyisoprenoid-binding protein YceI